MAVEMFTGEPLFPGDSDVDQLWLILKCMGQLPPAYADMLSRNEYFAVRPHKHRSQVSWHTNSNQAKGYFRCAGHRYLQRMLWNPARLRVNWF